MKTYFLTLKPIQISNSDGEVVATTVLPSKTEFKPDLKALQDQVGGYLEHFNIFPRLEQNGIDTWINDEGKLIEGLKPSFVLCDDQGKPLDWVYGNAVFTRFDDEGETYGLTDDDIELINEELNKCLICHYESKDGTEGYCFMVKGFSVPAWL